jgi:hypothetical protein
MALTSMRRRMVAAVLCASMALPGTTPMVLARAVQPSVPAAAVTLEAPLLRFVPEDAVIYVGWQGTSAPGYGGSKLDRLTKDQGIRKLVFETIPALMGEGDAEKTRESRAEIERVLGNIGEIYGRPAAVFVRLPTQPGGGPEVVMLVDGGADADKLAEKLKSELLGPGAGRMTFSRQGSVLAMSPNEDAKTLEVQGKPLAGKASFVSAMKRVGGAGQAVAFADFETILKFLGEMEPQAGRVLDLSGFGEMKGLALSAGFDDRGEWVTRLFEEVAGPRKGLAAALLGAGGEAKALELIGRVPAEAVSVSVVRLDLLKVLDEAVALAGSVSPIVGERAPMAWSAASAATGVRLREDFLSVISPEWTIFRLPAADQFSGLVAMNRPSDAAVALRSVDTMVRAGQRFALMSAPKGTEPPARIMMGSVDVGGVKVTTAKLVLSEVLRKSPEAAQFVDLTLMYGVKDGVMVLATSEAGMRAGLTPPEKPLVETKDFKEAMARLGAPATATFSYSTGRTAFELARAQLKLLEGASAVTDESATGRAPKVVVDAIKAVEQAVDPLMGPCATAVWTDDAGLHLRSVVPFPGAEAVTGDISGGVFVGAMALGAAVLLPSLSRARETAKRVSSASNLRQIAMAATLFANDNNGRMPDDLGSLLATADFSPEVFVSPRTSKSVPEDILAAGQQERMLWVNASSDYLYLGKGLAMGGDQDIVLAHERLDIGLRDGVNVAFLDGRVMFVRMDELPEILERSKKLRGQ